VPIERSLAYLIDIERSPNTVKAYAVGSWPPSFPGLVAVDAIAALVTDCTVVVER
jgi:hypothetical protein